MMNFLKKLDILMDGKGLNKHSLSKKCGIPYTTIDAFYKKGFENAKISTMMKLALFFDTTLDYLTRDEITDIHYGWKKEEDKNDPLTPEDIKIAHAYHGAGEAIKEGVRKMLDVELDEPVFQGADLPRAKMA